MDDELVSQFIWTAASINAHIEQIFQAYGKMLKLSRSQSMILSIIEEKGGGKGLPIKDVAALMHVDGSSVTQHVKKLEEIGLIKKTSSELDARVVLLTLSREGEHQVATLRSQKDTVRNIAFEAIDEPDFRNFFAQLVSLEKRLEKACAVLDIQRLTA